MAKKKTAPKKRTQKRSVNKKPAFLRAFIASASLTAAAEAVGIDRSIHYDWLAKDAEYAKAFEQARIEAGQTLEDDAVHWARIGVFEPLVYQGRFQFAERERTLCTLPDGREVFEEELPADLAGVEIVSRRGIKEQFGPPLGIFRRSEGLMARLLKAFIPDRYGDKTEVTGANGGAIEQALTVTFVRPKE